MNSTQQPAPYDAYATMRYPQFRLYIIAHFLITVALQIQSVLLAWRVYELTNDTLSLGLVGLAEVIPAVSVSLYAGYAVDKADKRSSYLWVALFFALFVALFGLVSTHYLDGRADSNKVVWSIYGLLFLWGIVRGFSMPAGFALMSNLIPTHLSVNAASWSSSTWQIAAIVGPIIAGKLNAWKSIGGVGILVGGFEYCFVLAFVLMLVAVGCIFFIDKQPPQPTTEREPAVVSIKQGLRFVFNSPIILGALSLDLFSVLFGGYIALLPAFAKDVLFVDLDGLATMRSAPSVGAALMLLWLTYNPPLRHTGYKLLGAVALFGVSCILFALSVHFYWSVFLLAAGGAFDAVSVQIRHTILQLRIPPDMRGRVASVNTIFISSSNELGAFESGVAARLMGGLVPSVVFGGCMTLVVVAATYIKLPVLRRFSMLEETKAAAQQNT